MSTESQPNGGEIRMSELEAFVHRVVAEQVTLLQSHPLQHSALTDKSTQSLVQKVRVRLAGFTADGKMLDDWIPDIQLLGDVESPFVEWLDEAQQEASTATVRDEENMTPKLLALAEEFHEKGGHISRYSQEQREFLVRHGIVAFIELLVREDLAVTVGAVSGLSSNPYSSLAAGQLFQPFPQFDFRDILIADVDDMQGLEELAKTCYLTCRSSVIPSMDHPFITEQLSGEQLPESLQGKSLLRLGMASRAKAVALLIAQKFGSEHVTSNIGTIKWGQGTKGWENLPSTRLNGWMSPMGWRKSFTTMVDEISRLRVALLAYISSLPDGIDALIGENGVATKKGHNLQLIHDESDKLFTGLQTAVESGKHAAWGDLKS